MAHGAEVSSNEETKESECGVPVISGTGEPSIGAGSRDDVG